MSSPFLAEVRIFPFNYAPRGWAFCNGQTLALSQNTALFSLLGTTYGGNGQSNFQLPNLQGSFPIQSGQGTGLSPYYMGETGGASTVALNTLQMPSHTHPENALVATGTATTPSGNLLTQPALRSTNYYGSDAATAAMAPGAVALAGNGTPHNNLPPYLVLSYCIALQGIYPARS